MTGQVVLFGKDTDDADTVARRLGYTRDEYKVVASAGAGTELFGLHPWEIIETRRARIGRNYDRIRKLLIHTFEHDNLSSEAWRHEGSPSEYDLDGTWIKSLTPGERHYMGMFGAVSRLPKVDVQNTRTPIPEPPKPGFAGPDLDHLRHELEWVVHHHWDDILRGSADVMLAALNRVTKLEQAAGGAK